MARLTQNSYGKSHVRLTKISRHGQRHELKELSVQIMLQGDFARCYTHGDNSKIIPTDTMKNTVYALAKAHPLTAIEDFAQTLASHFIDNFDHVASAIVEISEVPWQRIVVNGKPHDHSFVGGSSERRTCRVINARKEIQFEAGIDDLLVLKTNKSGFAGYIKDEYTTLKETSDRIFATSVQANWRYSSPPRDWNAAFESIRDTILQVFATHDSLAVQQTLYAMGDAVLKSCAEVSAIDLTMPNQHRLLVNLEPFGMQNPNEIFVPTDEPFGLITGTVSREG